MWEPGYSDLYVPRVFTTLTCAHCGAEVSKAHESACDWSPTGSYPDAATEAVTVGQCEQTEGLPDDGATSVLAGHTSAGYLVHVPVEGHRAIIRDDTHAVLATPTDSYELINHGQMGELLDAYTAAWRKAGAAAKFETAGVLKGGRMVWALVRLDEPYTIPGDESPTYPYVAMLNAHDGSAACKLLPTQVRVVCWNTWNAASALGDQTGHQVVIRHSGNVEERIDQAKEALTAVREETKAWQVMAADLAAINVSDAMVRQFAEEFIPTPDNASPRITTSRAERRALLVQLYNESPTCDGVRGSAYGLVQAAGEYLDHLRPFRNEDTYLARTMLRPEPIKAGVINLVRELAGAAN